MSARAVCNVVHGLLRERHSAELVEAFLQETDEEFLLRAQQPALEAIAAVGGDVA